MSKFIISFFVLVLLNGIASGQKSNSTYSIGIYLPVLVNNQVADNEKIEGNPSYHGKGYYSLGISYFYSNCTCSAYEIGMEYSNHSFTIIPAVDQRNNSHYSSNIQLLSIPLSLRLTILKFFYLSGGLLLDFDISNLSLISNQTGLGANFGIGFKFDFKSGLGFYLSPFYKSHSLITFVTSDYKQRLSESGIKLGLFYKF